MRDELTLKKLKLNMHKLLKIGFIKENNNYKYEAKILNDQFLLTIVIDESCVIVSDCIELSTNEKLMPYYVLTSNGEFIGEIREEYDKVVKKIKDNCRTKNVFKSQYANLLIKYVQEKYNDELEYLWKKFPNNAIWRNKENKKWYGILMVIERSKLGIQETGMVEIIDLLLEPEKIENIIDNQKYFLGYHMNKNHWITIKLDGSVDIKEIYGLLDHSFQLSNHKPQYKVHLENKKGNEYFN